MIIGKKDDIPSLAPSEQDEQNADDLQRRHPFSDRFASLIKSI